MKTHVVKIDRSKRLADEPGTGHNRWHEDIPPVLRIQPGDHVVLETRDALDGQLSPSSTAADVARADLRPAHNPVRRGIDADEPRRGVLADPHVLAAGRGRAGLRVGLCRLPILKAYMAGGMAQTGDLDNALLLIDESIAQVECPGWEERFAYAEILRLKGWMLSLKGDLGGAERNFLASLDWARRQEAKMWELRTSTSLVRLWQSQGKRQDAYELLAPVYDWFTEGFDTKELQEAKALLDELA